MSHYINTVLLVGCGYMGREYCKVLQALHADVCAVGRGEASAKVFYSETGVRPHIGGMGRFAGEQQELPQHVIVAVDMTELYETVELLLNGGVRNILVEKPLAVSYEQRQSLARLAKAKGADVFVAYNRRFYSSVREAKKLIAEDGGVSSFRFEFTEWGHQHLASGSSRDILNAMFIGNSTHVIDLAFYLGGIPQSMSSYTGGACTWCDKASRYSGAGITRDGACFSYFADWESAGRWSLEILTEKRKLVFCPLEELRSQPKGSLSVEKLEIDDTLDRQFKPGLYLQTKAFLDGDFQALLPIREHVAMCELYRQIEEGTTV